MTYIKPQTIESSLRDEIVQQLGHPKEYLDVSSSLPWRRLSVECDKLIGVDPGAGLILKSRLYVLSGDIENVRRCYISAEKYGLNLTDRVNYAIGLERLGFYSEAQQIFRLAVDPVHGDFNAYFSPAMLCGAYRFLLDKGICAENLGIKLNECFEKKYISSLVALMEKQEISDATLASYLDLAGEILRERRLFPAYAVRVAEGFDIDNLSLVHQVVEIDQSVETVADMNMQLMELIVEHKMPKSDSIMVSFEPVE